jgi:hypothetical protein
MPRTKKAPIFRYGIEITKPFSKEMYTHNDAIALEMKRHITSEIHKAYSDAKADWYANDEESTDCDAEQKLRKIVQAFTGYSFGDGYDLDDIKDEGINTLANIANWSLHQEYGYLCSEGIVPQLPMKMLGFDKAEDGCWDCYWLEEDGPIEKVQYDDAMNEIPGFEGTLQALDNLTTLSQSNEDLIKRHNTKLSSERMKDNPKFELSPNQLKNLIKEELKKDIK